MKLAVTGTCLNSVETDHSAFCWVRQPLNYYSKYTPSPVIYVIYDFIKMNPSLHNLSREGILQFLRSGCIIIVQTLI